MPRYKVELLKGKGFFNHEKRQNKIVWQAFYKLFSRGDANKKEYMQYPKSHSVKRMQYQVLKFLQQFVENKFWSLGSDFRKIEARFYNFSDWFDRN